MIERRLTGKGFYDQRKAKKPKKPKEPKPPKVKIVSGSKYGKVKCEK